MPTNQPRVSTVVEQPLYELIESLAARDRMSLSQKVRDLLAGAIEIIEDASLESVVSERKRTSKTSYSLNQVKKQLKRK